MMPPLFSAMLMLSVTKNAGVMVEEIRRQFRDIPGLIEGKVLPDSARCVDIAAAGALKELVLPAILALFTPILVGFLLGPAALGGFLAGTIVTGILFALLMANAGGLWTMRKSTSKMARMAAGYARAMPRSSEIQLAIRSRTRLDRRSTR